MVGRYTEPISSSAPAATSSCVPGWGVVRDIRRKIAGDERRSTVSAALTPLR